MFYYKGKMIPTGGGSGGTCGENYSTEETRIGTWTDGKPVYRRVVELTTPSSISSNTLCYSTNEFIIVDKLTGFYGFMHDANGNDSDINTLGELGTDKNKCRTYLDTDRGIYMNVNSSFFINRPCWIVVEYTKTDDIPDYGAGMGGSTGNTSLDVYSTEETRIGTWIDGKPMYRRVINLTSPTTIDTDVVIGSVSDMQIQMITKLSCIQYDTPFFVQPVPFYAPSGDQYFGLTIWIDGGSIKSHVMKSYHAGKPMLLILEYTKTTDQATIELPAMLTARNAETFSIDTLPIQAASVTAGDAEIRNDGAETMNDYAEIRNEEV